MRKRQSSNATLDSQMYERVGISSNKLEVFSVAMAHESHRTTFPNTRTIDFLSSHCLFPLKLGNEGAQEVRSNGQKERPELNCCEFLGVSAHQGPEGVSMMRDSPFIVGKPNKGHPTYVEYIPPFILSFEPHP